MSQGLPETDRLTDEQQYASRTWMQWLSWVHRVVSSVTQSGTTSQRPDSLLWIGRSFYDVTLNKPVYVAAVRPTVWRDAAGVVV
jgi:hypothetical protein